MVLRLLREIRTLISLWRADSYGPGHLCGSLCAAIVENRPRLFWLSVSRVEDRDAFLADYRLVYETARELGIAVVVGGRALDDDLRREMSYSTFCDTLGHMADFVRTLVAPPTQ